MTRRESVAPAGPPREAGRRSLATLPEIVSLLDDEASPRDVVRSPRSDRVALVAASWSGVIAQRRRGSALVRDHLPAWSTTCRRPNTALVVVIAEDASDRDGDGALRRLRGRAPAAKFVFLAGRQDDEKSRSLAVWGAVLPPSADMERVDRAVRHASALSTMSAEMRRLKESGRLGTPSFPPPGSDES